MRSRHAVARFAIAAIVVSALATTTLSTPAWADAHSDAVKAFEEGRKLRETDPEKAARAFEQSISLEPSIGAYYNLGQVNEQLNRLREAVEAFRTAEKLAVQKFDSRNKDARDAWGKILDTHNYVVLNVSEEIKNAPGLKITVDNVPVPEAQFNGEVFRPTTTHEVLVSATGRKDVRLQTVPNRQPVPITLGIVAGESTSGPPPPPPPPAETSSGGWGWQKWTGTGLMAVGVGGVAYSLISFSSYLIKKSGRLDAAQPFHDNCQGSHGRFTGCTVGTGLTKEAANAAYDAYNANENDATASEPVWIVVGSAGVVLLGAGLYLFATAPSPSTEAPPPSGAVRVHVIPQIGIHNSGLSVVGTF